MPVTPFSTPLKTEYKPLGLEAFARPLSEIQGKYDSVLTAIKDADFAINSLDKDNPRNKELVSEFEGLRDELAQNLLTTGNYKQALDKAKQLNKLFTKDEEIKGIQSNYALYTEAKKEQQERVSKGDITQQDFDLWDFKARTDFQGTQYDKKSGKYNTINVRPRMKNMEKEIMDKSLELARMAPTWTTEQFVQTMAGLGMSAGQIDYIKEKFEKRDLNQVSSEIENFLRQSDQYKNWVIEDADYKWDYATKTDPNYINGFLENYNSVLDSEKLRYQELLKQNPGNAPEIQAEIDKLSKTQTDFLTGLQASIKNGTVEDFAKTLFTNYALDSRFGGVSFGASDMVDVVNQTFSVNEAGTGRKKAEEKLKEMDGISIATNVTGVTGKSAQYTIGTGSTGVLDEYTRAGASAYESLLEQKRQFGDDKIPGYEGTLRTYDPNKKEDVPYIEAKNANITMYTVLSRNSNFEKDIQKLNSDFADINSQIATATTEEQKKELKSKANIIAQDIEEKKLAKYADIDLVEKIISQELNKEYVTPEIKNLYEQSGNDVAVFLRKLREANTEFLTKESETATQKYQQTINELAKQYPDVSMQELEKMAQLTAVDIELKAVTNMEQVSTEPKPAKPLEEQVNIIDPNKIGEVPQLQFEGKPGQVQVVIDNVKKIPAEVMFANNAMNRYSQYLKTITTSTPLEIITDKNLEKMTNGESLEFIEYAKANQVGGSRIVQVDYNPSTAKTKEKATGDRFTLSAYSETPHWVGNDENGDAIFRYSIKPEFTGDRSTVNTAVATYLKDQKEKTTPDDATVPTATEIEQWVKDNPTDLYVVMKGRSNNLASSAREHYTEWGESAIKISDFKNLNKNIQNYAPIHMIGDPERRKLYYQMGATLDAALKDPVKAKNVVLTQPPAAWQQNEDQTFTGYAIQYYVKDGSVIAQINKGILDPTKAEDQRITWQAINSVDLLDKGNNLPVLLVQMDLLYGTGREEDLVTHQESLVGDVPFVPAFYGVTDGTPTIGK